MKNRYAWPKVGRALRSAPALWLKATKASSIAAQTLTDLTIRNLQKPQKRKWAQFVNPETSRPGLVGYGKLRKVMEGYFGVSPSRETTSRIGKSPSIGATRTY